MSPIDIKSEEEFADLTRSGVVVVDFYAPWCGACKKFMPDYESIASEYGSSAKFLKVDVDELEEIAGDLGVTQLPFLVILNNGSKAHTSAMPGKADVIAKLSELGVQKGAAGGETSAKSEEAKAPEIGENSLKFSNFEFSTETVLRLKDDKGTEHVIKKLKWDPSSSTIDYDGGKVSVPLADTAAVTSKLLTLASDSDVPVSGFKVKVPTIDVDHFTIVDPGSKNVLSFSIDKAENNIVYSVNGAPRPPFKSAHSDGSNKVVFPEIKKGATFPKTNLHINIASLKSLIAKVGGEAVGFPDEITQ
eukprot:TRINITY_DN24280_c0_g1_i1.p1 TRINITY_DN24280_c0_g1~~TRINITY_DN24280_c0_g1_i1.p1  ORF type:complete len:324 (+),score=67.59 TRINITY_DN24280_c0_g1_i1:61-972(+)